MKSILLYAKNPALIQAVRLILEGESFGHAPLPPLVLPSQEESETPVGLVLEEEEEATGLLFLRIGRHRLAFPFLRREFLSAVKEAMAPGHAEAEVLPGRKYRFPNGRTVSFTPKEWALFLALKNADGPIPREVLEDILWQGGSGKEGLNVYIHKLRKKLELDGKRRILSCRGRGYRLLEESLEKEEAEEC